MFNYFKKRRDMIWTDALGFVLGLIVTIYATHTPTPANQSEVDSQTINYQILHFDVCGQEATAGDEMECFSKLGLRPA